LVQLELGSGRLEQGSAQLEQGLDLQELELAQLEPELVQLVQELEPLVELVVQQEGLVPQLLPGQEEVEQGLVSQGPQSVQPLLERALEEESVWACRYKALQCLLPRSQLDKCS
jgi:hypothetical protein